MMSSAKGDHYGDNWLGLCTPFICLHRKERSTEESLEHIRSSIMLSNERDLDSYDALERLANIFDGLFRLDSRVLTLKTREAFVKSCLSDHEQFNIKIIAKGMHNMDDLATQIAKEHTIDEESLSNILGGLKLPEEAKLGDAVKAITYHFINKLNCIQHDLQDALREYDLFHNSTTEEFENLRRRFFNLTLSRNKGEHGIDFSISKADFKLIVNSQNDKVIDVIFSLLDDDDDGLIDWGGFELNSGRILSAAKEYL